MTDTPIIRIMDLTKAYGSKTAVDHLNLEIRRGRDFRSARTERCGKNNNNINAPGLDRTYSWNGIDRRA